MGVNKQSARIKHHTSTTTGTFTVPTSEDFTDGSWDKWDLAKSEIGVNEFDETVSIRIGSNVYDFYTTASPISSSNIGNSDLTISTSGARKLILGGALTSDYFVIRNSADSADYFKVRGDGYAQFGSNVGVGVVPISTARMYLTASSGYGVLSNGANYSYGTGSFNVNGFYSAQIGNNKTAFRCENPGGGTGGTCTAFGTASWGTNTGGTYVAFDASVNGTSTTAKGFRANVTGGTSNNYAIEIVNGDIKTPSGLGQTGTYTFGGGSSGDIATMQFEKGVLIAVTTVP